jgi:hypothetical protein
MGDPCIIILLEVLSTDPFWGIIDKKTGIE